MLNIRSYQHQKIDFPDGSFLLSGDIGFGKSTILLAIEFALFGLGDIAASSLLRRGQREGMVRLEFDIDSELYAISRSLQKKGENIIQASGYISNNGNKREMTPTELKAEILNILGYPKELLSKQKNPIYRYTVYTPQEEMKQILLAKKEERMEILRKIFGVDRYKIIRDNSDIIRLELKRKASSYGGEIKRFSEIKDELKKTNDVLLTLNSNLESIKKNLDTLKNNEKNLRKNSEEIEKRYTEYQNIIREIAVKESEIKNLEESLAKMKARIVEFIGEKTVDLKLELSKKELDHKTLLTNISNAKNQIRILNSNKINSGKLEGEIATKKTLLEKLEKEIKLKQDKISEFKEDYSRDIGDIKKEIKIFEKNIEQIHLRKKGVNKDFDALVNSKEKYNKRVTDNQIEISKAEARINLLEKDLSSLKNLSGVPLCPLCKQNISEEHREKEILRINQERSELDSKYKESLELNNKLQIRIQELESEILKIIENHVFELKEKISGLQNNVEQKEKYNSLIKEINELKSEQLKLNNDISKKIEEQNKISLIIEKLLPFENEIVLLEKNNELIQKEIANMKEAINVKQNIDDASKKHDDLSKNLSTLIIKRTQLSVSENDRKRIQDSLKNVTEERIKKEREEAEKSSELKLLSERTKIIQIELEKLEKYKVEKENFENISNWIDKYFIGLMETMEKEFMESLRRQFEELFARWLENLLEDEDINVVIDEDFTPHIRQEGFDADYESLSGGERTSIALAYRLALNRVINNLVDEIKTQDIIILDEPTDGFSRKQLDRVRDVLDMLNMRQIIIVSHEPEIESYVDHVLKVTKRDGVSRVEGQDFIDNARTTFGV